MRRIPLFATLVVLVAAGIMIRLGFWQLERLRQKEALIADYAAARSHPAEIAWTAAGVGERLLYRRARLTCASVSALSSIAGRNAAGTVGMAQTATCRLADGGKALVVLGWSQRPVAAAGSAGGDVHGVIAPGPRLVANPPLAGLQANAVPDPADIPNNHLSYAVQWFLFAATALAIFGIAVIKRLKRT